MRRRWLDFRQGHSIYLVFLMTFANFITIQYALLIDRIPALNTIFSNLWVFAVLFVAGYIPISIAVGHWHRKSQLKIEQEAIFNENVMNARMWLFIMELIEGKVSDAEKVRMRSMLRGIAKKMHEGKKSETDILTDESKPA
jgi:hypothetical protein